MPLTPEQRRLADLQLLAEKRDEELSALKPRTRAAIVELVRWMYRPSEELIRAVAIAVADEYGIDLETYC